MITLSPGSVSTMSEAPLAASVASATAIPISAFFKAGASFTPSPVIPTIYHAHSNGAYTEVPNGSEDFLEVPDLVRAVYKMGCLPKESVDPCGNNNSFNLSLLAGSPSRRRASAGMMSPSLMLTISPGTRIAASCSLHRPSLSTCSPAIRAAAALPALFSSMKLIVELMTSKQTIPTKSCQSGGFPSPLASAIAIMAAASITHDRGFHINPRNFSNLLSWISTPNHP
nr:hypothetical protein Ccrd_025584 [Ipomoea trifida]